MKRFLEINNEGYAFHEPGISSPFTSGQVAPPKEVFFCDCEGIGTNCHHIYDGDKHFEVYGNEVSELHRDEWLTDHKDPECKIRRQFFVDVTNRPEAKLGMFYDETNDKFLEKKPE